MPSSITAAMIIAIMRVFLFTGSLLPQYLSNALLATAAGQHQFMAAATALEPDIHTNTQDLPSRTAAGMRFLQFHSIMQSQVHLVPPVNPAAAAA